MKKSISWYQLYKRIGKQTLHKTRNTKVQVLIDGELHNGWQCHKLYDFWWEYC